MKYKEIIAGTSPLKTNLSDFSQNQLIAMLNRDCSDYLGDAENNAAAIMYRGLGEAYSNQNYPEAFKSSSPAGNRRAIDTPMEIQQSLDNALQRNGFDAVRSNSIFVSNSLTIAKGYGPVYFIVPCNGYKSTWCKATDFFTNIVVGKRNLSWPDFLKQSMLVFTQEFKDLQSAILNLEKLIDNKLRSLSAIENPSSEAELLKIKNAVYFSLDSVRTAQKNIFGPAFDYSTVKDFIDLAAFTPHGTVPILTNDPEISRLFIDIKHKLKVMKISDKNIAELEDLFIKRLGFVKNNALAGLAGGKEVYISGAYYAFSLKSYQDLFKELFKFDAPILTKNWGDDPKDKKNAD